MVSNALSNDAARLRPRRKVEAQTRGLAPQRRLARGVDRRAREEPEVPLPVGRMAHLPAPGGLNFTMRAITVVGVPVGGGVERKLQSSKSYRTVRHAPFVLFKYIPIEIKITRVVATNLACVVTTS